MLTSGLGGMESVFARSHPVVLRQELNASDDRTYEITVSYDLELEEGEEPPEEPKLVVRELLEPEPACEPAPAAEAAFEDEAAPEDGEALEAGLMAAAASEDEAAPEGEDAPAAEAAPEGEAESLFAFTVGAEAEAAPAAEAEAEDTEGFDLSYGEYVTQAAEALEWNPGKLQTVHVFDISLHDPYTGEEIEPENSVRVSIRLLDKEMKEDTLLSVVHFAGDEEKPEIMASMMIEGAVAFDTDSFSVYVIVEDGEENENSRIGYTFWYPDSSGSYTEICTEFFRRKDVLIGNLQLYSPSLPALVDGELFCGWYKGSVVNGKVVLDEQEVTVSATSVYDTRPSLNDELQENAANSSYPWKEGTRINVYARLDAAYYITYADIVPSNVLATDVALVADTGTTTFTVKPGVRPTKYGEKLHGWRKLDEDNSVIGDIWQEGSEQEITGNIKLYPNIEGGHWLVFDDNDMVWDAAAFKFVSGGASYTPAVLYMNVPAEDLVENTVSPLAPTRAGYTFGGWYTSPDCLEGEEFAFGSPLTGDVTVYAKWIAGTASYRVVYWKQSPKDLPDIPDEEKTWEYADSRKVTINPITEAPTHTGEVVYIETSDKNVYGENGTSEDTDKKYFKFNENLSDEFITIKPDNSSVLNVYYDRKKISHEFYTAESNTPYYTKSANGTWGAVGGEFIQLQSKPGDSVYSYSFNPTYTPVTSQTDTRYGIVNGEYVLLTATPITGSALKETQIYKLTNTLKNEKEKDYLIVSHNTAGSSSYALGKDGHGSSVSATAMSVTVKEDSYR